MALCRSPLLLSSGEEVDGDGLGLVVGSATATPMPVNVRALAAPRVATRVLFRMVSPSGAAPGGAREHRYRIRQEQLGKLGVAPDLTGGPGPRLRSGWTATCSVSRERHSGRTGMRPGIAIVDVALRVFRDEPDRA